MPTKSPGGQNGGPEKRGVFGAFLGVPRGGQKTGFFRVFSGFSGFLAVFGQKPGFWPKTGFLTIFDRFWDPSGTPPGRFWDPIRVQTWFRLVGTMSRTL